MYLLPPTLGDLHVCVVVAPTRCRPPNFDGGAQMENPQNNSLKSIINKNLQMRQLSNEAKALLAPPHPDEIRGTLSCMTLISTVYVAH